MSLILQEAPARRIGDVIARMRAIAEVLPAPDGVGVFTALYLAVTQAVEHAMRGESFEDEGFIRALDVAFANLYFDALRDFAAGDGSIPRAWAPLVDSRGRRDVMPLQFALAGMNAHINRDLPVALIETCRALGVELQPQSPQHRDFRRIDGVLAKTEAEVKRRFVTGAVAELDVALGPVDDVLAMWNVERAREAAWVNGELLWHIRDAPGLRADFLQTLDRMVGFASRGLLRPLALDA